MRRRILLLAPLSLVIAMAACTTATPYQPAMSKQSLRRPERLLRTTGSSPTVTASAFPATR